MTHPEHHIPVGGWLGRFVRELRKRGRIETDEGVRFVFHRILGLTRHGVEIERFMYPRKFGGRGSLEHLPSCDFTRGEVDILCVLLHRLLSEKGKGHGTGSGGKVVRFPTRGDHSHES